MRVLGVDPGTLKTGVGIVEENGRELTPVFFETIPIKAGQSRQNKLLQIYDGILQVIREHKPEVMALEDVFFSRNFKAAIRIGEARSAAMVAAAVCGVPVAEYLPTRVKESICGHGRAGKHQIQYMTRVLLKLKDIPEEDAADALAAAICHIYTEKKLIRKPGFGSGSPVKLKAIKAMAR